MRTLIAVFAAILLSSFIEGTLTTTAAVSSPSVESSNYSVTVTVCTGKPTETAKCTGTCKTYKLPPKQCLNIPSGVAGNSTFSTRSISPSCTFYPQCFTINGYLGSSHCDKTDPEEINTHIPCSPQGCGGYTCNATGVTINNNCSSFCDCAPNPQSLPWGGCQQQKNTRDGNVSIRFEGGGVDGHPFVPCAKYSINIFSKQDCQYSNSGETSTGPDGLCNSVGTGSIRYQCEANGSGALDSLPTATDEVLSVIAQHQDGDLNDKEGGRKSSRVLEGLF